MLPVELAGHDGLASAALRPLNARNAPADGCAVGTAGGGRSDRSCVRRAPMKGNPLGQGAIQCVVRPTLRAQRAVGRYHRVPAIVPVHNGCTLELRRQRPSVVRNSFQREAVNRHDAGKRIWELSNQVVN